MGNVGSQNIEPTKWELRPTSPQFNTCWK